MTISAIPRLKIVALTERSTLIVLMNWIGKNWYAISIRRFLKWNKSFI